MTEAMLPEHPPTENVLKSMPEFTQPPERTPITPTPPASSTDSCSIDFSPLKSFFANGSDQSSSFWTELRRGSEGMKFLNLYSDIYQYSVLSTTSLVLQRHKQKTKIIRYHLSTGYDVWMPNVRGNKYSKNHVTYDSCPTCKEYWSFGLEEPATIDYPASIDYILNITQV